MTEYSRKVLAEEEIEESQGANDCKRQSPDPPAEVQYDHATGHRHPGVEFLEKEETDVLDSRDGDIEGPKRIEANARQNRVERGRQNCARSA